MRVDTARGPRPQKHLSLAAMRPSTPLAETLLVPINLLITAYGGAALATAARLKWDPSTYVAVRALFPTEYLVLAAALSGCGAALLLLPLLVAVAAHHRCSTTYRRNLLVGYAWGMGGVCACEAALASWLLARALRWLRTPAAAAVLAALDPDGWIQKALRWFLPDALDQLLQEASEDAPVNLYVAVYLGALLALLQAAAVLLVALRARAPLATTRAAPPPAKLRV